jgi:hypothetical protein
MTTLTTEQLLYEIEDIIRSMPEPRDFEANPQKCIPWLGRANAAMSVWDAPRSIVHFEPLVKNYSHLSAQHGNFTVTADRKLTH